MNHVASDGTIVPCPGLRCRICRLIDRDGPHYREPYRRLFHPEEFGGAASVPSLPVAESLRLNRRMQVCPFRTMATDCGCGGLARCAVGLGRHGLVNHHDCHACLSRDGVG